MKKSNLVKEAVCGLTIELTTVDMWTMAPLAERVNIYLKVERWRVGKYSAEDPEKWAQACGFKDANHAEQIRKNTSDSQFKEDVFTLMKFINKITTEIPKSNIFDED